MNCHTVKKLLVRFLEGELCQKNKEEVERHLKMCVGCQREKELFSQSWQMLDNYPTPKLKADFTASLMRRIHLGEAEIITVRYGLPRFVLRPFVPATVMLVLIITFLWWHTMTFRGYYNNGPEAAFISIIDNRDDRNAADLGTSIEKYFIYNEL